MTTDFTTYFKWGIPDFNTAPWHADWDALVRDIDQTLFKVFFEAGAVLWTNSHVFEIGDIAIDPSDGSFWVVATAHTSAATPTTFAADRALNPGFWTDPFASGGPGGTGRELLTNDRTYFVRTDGNDGNSGLANTSGAAFATIQHAVNVVGTLDCNNFDVTVQVANGTYNENPTLPLLVGADEFGGDVILRGDPVTPTNVIINGAVYTQNDGWRIDGFKLTPPTGTAITAEAAKLDIRNLNFGASASHHILAHGNACIACNSNYTISGSAAGAHWKAERGGVILVGALTITLSGTPDFGATGSHLTTGFASADDNSVIRAPGCTFTGAATGLRFAVSRSSTISTDTDTLTYLPGNTAGIRDSGGLYNKVGVFTSVFEGIVPASGGGTTNFLRADGTWAAPSASGQPLDADLTALANNSTDGFWAHTGAGTGAARTLTGTAAQISITNGAGIAGDPVFSFPADVLIPTILTVPNTGLHILDTNASHDLIIKPGSNITADRTLTLTTGDTDMIVNLTAVTDEFVLAYDTSTNTWRGVASSGGTPTVITVANEATDTTCFPAFFTAATGDLGPKTNASLTYNSNTGAFSIGTSAAFTAGTIELGAASDTTLARVSAGVVSIEGSNILTALTGQPLDTDLSALAANSTDGFWAHTGAGTGSARTLTAPAAGLTISNPAGIAGNPTFALANDLSALEGLGSTGYAVRTAADTWAQRTLTGTAAQISITNGDGTVGNPVFSFPADILVPTVLTVPNTGLHLLDTNASHDLIIAPGSDITADRTLTLTTGDASRTVTLNGNPTLDDWFDQSVKAAATPTFAGINFANVDTTVSRVSAGDIQIESNIVYRAGGTDVALADGGTGQSLADPGADRLMGWDEDTNTVRFMALADIISEAAPAAGDFVIIYGAEGDVRKTNWNLLPGTGGGIASVSADPAPALGGNLDANTFSILFDDNTGILDQNGNEVLIFQTVTSAVNYIDLFDAATGGNPKFAANGSDTDIGIDFAVKAAGKFNFLATSSGPAEVRFFEDADNGTNYAGVVAPAALGSNITLTLPNTTGTIALVGAGSADLQEFTAGGTWTKPSGATFVLVECWGAGGGGGSGRRGVAGQTRNGGTGGGGGAYAFRLFKASECGSTETVTIGAGGTAGAAITVDTTDGNNGGNGGNTTFGSLLTAFGGGGGSAGTNAAIAPGAGGGVLSAGALSVGGQPWFAAANTTGGHFGGAITSATTAQNPSGFGGGTGGPFGASPLAGACSYQGGPGGGCGGFINAANTASAGAAGGSITGATGGGGAAGASAGLPGAAGTGRQGGGGGFGGTTTGGAGGAGGQPAGGGGGGGASLNGNNSGAGGVGGAGLCRVYSW